MKIITSKEGERVIPIRVGEREATVTIRDGKRKILGGILGSRRIIQIDSEIDGQITTRIRGGDKDGVYTRRAVERTVISTAVKLRKNQEATNEEIPVIIDDQKARVSVVARQGVDSSGKRRIAAHYLDSSVNFLNRGESAEAEHYVGEVDVLLMPKRRALVREEYHRALIKKVVKEAAIILYADWFAKKNSDLDRLSVSSI